MSKQTLIISDFNEACLDSLITLSKSDPIIKGWVISCIDEVNVEQEGSASFNGIKYKMLALLSKSNKAINETELNVEKNKFGSNTRFEKKHAVNSYKYGTAILAVDKNIAAIKDLISRVNSILGKACPYHELVYASADAKGISDYRDKMNGMRIHKLPFGIRVPKEMYIYKGDSIKKGLFEFDISIFAERVALVTSEFRILLESEQKKPIQSPTMSRLIEAEIASLKEFAWVNNGVIGPSFSNRNPDFFLNKNYSYEYPSLLIKEYKERYRGIGDCEILKYQKFFEDTGSLAMVLGKNTGMSFASRGTDGDWNTFMTVLSGVVGYHLEKGSITIKQLELEWKKFSDIPLNTSPPGTRLGRGDEVPLTVNTRNGVVVFGWISGVVPKGRHIAIVQKFLHVLNRKIAKRSLAMLAAGDYYITDMVRVRKIVDQAYNRKKEIQSVDYSKQDRHYTPKIMATCVDIFCLDKRERDFLNYEVCGHALIQPRYLNDDAYLVELNGLINPSGVSTTGANNTCVAELNQGAFKQAAVGSYNKYRKQYTVDQGYFSIGSGDDGLFTMADGIKGSDMISYIEKQVGFKTTGGDLPIYLSIFFGPNFTTNIMANAIQNHLTGEHAKDHPLILTVSLGVHYSLLNQHPFFKWWEKAINEHILSIPGYAFHKTVEECHRFVTSQRAINLLTAYAANSMANAEKLRSVIRGLVYGYASSEGAQLPMDKDLTNFLASVYALNVGDQGVTFNPDKSPVDQILWKTIRNAMEYSVTGSLAAKANVTILMQRFMPNVRHEYIDDKTRHVDERKKRRNTLLDDD